MGADVGKPEGDEEDVIDGKADEVGDADFVGSVVDDFVGILVGDGVGIRVGRELGLSVGLGLGGRVGASVGGGEGSATGLSVACRTTSSFKLYIWKLLQGSEGWSLSE